MAAVLPLLTIMLGQGPLLQLQSQFQKARDQFEQAVQTTRLQLMEQSRELRSNPALTQDLNEQSYNAASRILGGYVVPGRIDQLAVLDQNCKYMAHSEQGLLLSADCPLQNLSPEQSGFQWRIGGDRPTLEWIMPLGTFGERRLVLLASTTLKDSWLFSFQSLRSSFRNLDLNFGNGTRKLVELSPGADLYSQHWALRYYPSLLDTPMITLQKPMLGALLLFGIALWNVLRQLKIRELKLTKEVEGLQQWARDLHADTGGDQDSSGTSSAIARIQESLNRLVKRNYEQLQSCRQHSHTLSQQIVGLEARVLDQQVEQAWLQKARSLHQQMNSAAEAHLQKLQDAHSLGEDISHLAAAQLVRPAQKIYELGQRWADELQTVSPRKLVRSLAERVDENGRSQLELAVATIVESSQNLSNSAINITLLSQTMLDQLKENTQLAEHWHRLMGGPDKASKSLHRLIVDSQSLIELQEKDLAVKYENQVEDETLQHLKIPESTLHSVLYHCQMALIELARERAWATPVLHYQCKKREDKTILVLSLRGPSDDDGVTTQLPGAGEQHQNLAAQLLQGYPLKLTRLPSLQGIQAMALIWDRYEEKTAPAPSRVSRAPDQI